MGLLSLLKPGNKDVAATRSALDEARDPASREDGAVAALVQKLLDTGIDGRGPAKSSVELAQAALAKEGSTEAAVEALARQANKGAAVGGFATSVGGFFTMLVSIPVNVLEFYLQATRLVAAIAHLRGYDVNDPEIRTAVLLTLSGQNADDILSKVGISTMAGGTATTLLRSQLPKSALMLVNKAVGFRILRSVGEKTLFRLGRAIPLAGGAIGGAMDWYLMGKIAKAAQREFPAVRG